MRIFKSFQAYGTYLDLFYEKNKSLKHESFHHQINVLKNDCFPWILSWSKFNKDLSVEIFETIHNAYYLQQAWANDEYINDPEWIKKILLKQIMYFRPDVCVIYPPELFDAKFIEEIKLFLNNDVLIGGYDGMNRLDISKYTNYDFVLTCSKYISEYYQNNGMKTYALEFGFDLAINEKLDYYKKTPYKIGFTGSIFPIHQYRFEIVDYLAKNTDITISTEYGNGLNYSLFSKDFIKSVIKGKYSTYYSNHIIQKKNIGPKYGIEMFQFLKDSAISLNIHGNQINTGDPLKFAANVRLYEATGVGSCLLTDWKENISDIFIPGEEIETFTCKEEALDKAKFLIKNEAVRKDIAKKGQIRTIHEYSYEQRIKNVVNYIKTIA